MNWQNLTIIGTHSARVETAYAYLCVRETFSRNFLAKPWSDRGRGRLQGHKSENWKTLPLL